LQFESYEGKKHTVFWLEIDEKKLRRTVLSHGRKDVYGGVLSGIAGQIAVKTSELLELAKCTKSRDWYYDNLRTKHQKS